MILKIFQDYIRKYMFLPKQVFFLLQSLFSYFFSFHFTFFHLCVFHELLYYSPSYANGIWSPNLLYIVIQTQFNVQKNCFLLHGIKTARSRASLVLFVVCCSPSAFITKICLTSFLPPSSLSTSCFSYRPMWSLLY